MSRRNQGGDIGFGSDSFLDVVANMVGILIILIVLAGLRVSRAPVDLGAKLPPAAMAAPVAAPQVSPELIRRISALESELAALETDAREQSVQLDQAAARELELDAHLQLVSDNVLNESKLLEQAREQTREISEKVAAQERRLAELRTHLERVEREKTKVTQVEHRLTPFSRKVNGKEIHFRLAENRVAYVPIEELAERLKGQVERHKERLLEQRAVEGQVGPVGGFTMNYILARQPTALFPKVEDGKMMVRVELAEWQLEPEPDLPAETGDEALRKGSAFIRNLRAASDETTVTFWVYPDSFGLYRRLQKFAHQEGYVVAARPLPFGIPISGSPHGTRSAGH